VQLKREKELLHRKTLQFPERTSQRGHKHYGIAGKLQTAKSPQEIAHVVRKVGTNRLLSRKTVTFSFAQPYDFIPSLLASCNTTTSTTSPSLRDENLESPVWCTQ
jgi:hypothetical protein